jgi:flavin reductase (DIM6/NTAB) family NADH-FMN oxidoreductase RutF
MATGDELRAVLRRYPTGVAVVTVDTGHDRLGLTVGTLVSLSLEPPLVGISVSRQAALHELLREARAFGASLLADGQSALAAHFARGVPPLALWHGIELRPGEGAPLLAGAVGWLRCTLLDELPTGDHTFFVGAVEEVEAGPGGRPLVHLDGGYGAP